MKEGDLSAGRLAGTIATRADRRTKKGTPMLSLRLSDPSGSFEVIGFSEAVEQFGKILQPGRSVILNVEADERPDGISLRLMSAVPLDEAAQKARQEPQNRGQRHQVPAFDQVAAQGRRQWPRHLRGRPRAGQAALRGRYRQRLAAEPCTRRRHQVV